MKIINDITQFLLYPNFTGWLLVIKMIFLFFTAVFLGFTIIALVKTTWLKRLILWDLKEFLTFRPYGLKKLTKEWGKIKKRLDTGLESEAKLAVIEADSLLDVALKRMRYPGESLGERLDKLTVDTLSNLEGAREAHRIRNNIIHDPTYKLEIEEAKKVLAVYEKALIELEEL